MRQAISFFLIVGAVFGAGAEAQDDEDENKKKKAKATTQNAKKEQEVLITSSPLNPRDVFDTPYSSDVIIGDDFTRRRLARTLPDAFKEVPGVNVQKTGPGQGSPFIRGWTGYRNVMLIDGIRLNNSTFRDGPNQYWATVDPFLVDRLEIVRGPSSVLYGSDSIGGTVSAFSFEPDTLTPGLHLHSHSFVRYASGENSYTVRQSFSGNSDEFGWVVGGTYRDFNDISGGKVYGLMKGTGYDEYAADAKFVYRLSEHAKLILGAQHDRTDDASRWHSSADSRSWHRSTPGTDRVRDFDQERDLLYLQYHVNSPGGLVDAFKASVSVQRQNEDETRITGAGNKENRQFNVVTPAVWVQAGKKTGAGYFTAGAEYYHDDVDSSAYNRSAAGATTTFARGPLADDATYDLFGVYVQDELSFGSLDLTPGIRFTRAQVDAKKVDPIPGDAVNFNPVKDTYQAVTGSLRALVHIDEHWNLIGGWGMGFRAPSLNDSTSFNLALSGTIGLPVEGLKPEVFHTFDLGTRARYDAWEFSLFGFYTIIDRFLVGVPAPIPPGAPAGVTAATTKTNGGDGSLYGFEVGGLYRLTDEVSVFADYGYAMGRVEQDLAGVSHQQPLGKLAPMIFHAGLRYEVKASRVWVEGLISGAGPQSRLSDADKTDLQRIPPGGTPGYVVYGLRAGYGITDNVWATISIENIADRDYRFHGSGQNEPGTNVILSLDARF